MICVLLAVLIWHTRKLSNLFLDFEQYKFFLATFICVVAGQALHTTFQEAMAGYDVNVEHLLVVLCLQIQILGSFAFQNLFKSFLDGL